MNIKFIAAAVLLILVYVGYPKYITMKREGEVRTFFKGAFAEEVKKEAQSKINKNFVELDILNQYPNFRIYQKYSLEASKLPKLPPNIDQLMKQGMCEQVNALTSSQGNSKDIEAFKNVIEEDKVTFFIIVKDKFGQEIIEFKQQISECSKLGLETSKLDEVQQPAVAEPVEAAPAVTAPTEEAASEN